MSHNRYVRGCGHRIPRRSLLFATSDAGLESNLPSRPLDCNISVSRVDTLTTLLAHKPITCGALPTTRRRPFGVQEVPSVSLIARAQYISQCTMHVNLGIPPIVIEDVRDCVPPLGQVAGSDEFLVGEGRPLATIFWTTSGFENDASVEAENKGDERIEVVNNLLDIDAQHDALAGCTCTARHAYLPCRISDPSSSMAMHVPFRTTVPALSPL